jgi:hypothetical protein
MATPKSKTEKEKETLINEIIKIRKANADLDVYDLKALNIEELSALAEKENSDYDTRFGNLIKNSVKAKKKLSLR